MRLHSAHVGHAIASSFQFGMHKSHRSRTSDPTQQTVEVISAPHPARVTSGQIDPYWRERRARSTPRQEAPPPWRRPHPRVSPTPGHRGDSLSKSVPSLSFLNFLLCNQTNGPHQASDSFGGCGSGNSDGNLSCLATGRLSCVTAACSVCREDTLSQEETEVISRHTAPLCELCKHTPPPQPKDIKKEWRWCSGGEMRKGYWDPKGHAEKKYQKPLVPPEISFDDQGLEKVLSINFYKLLSWSLQSFKVKNIVCFNCHNAITDFMSVIAFVRQPPRPFVQHQTDECTGNDVIANMISQRASLNNVKPVAAFDDSDRHESSRVANKQTNGVASRHPMACKIICCYFHVLGLKYQWIRIGIRN